MADAVKGSCHCGAVTVSAPATPIFTFSCHCSGCKKLSSGGRLLGHSVSLETVSITGDTKTYTYAGGSGEDIVLTFCPHCSTQIMGEPKHHPGMAVIRAPILEGRTEFSPMQFLHTDGSYSWDKTE